VYEFKDITYHTTDLVYECQVAGLDKLTMAEEASEILFIAPSDVEPDQLAFDSIRRAIAAYAARGRA
jgi:hypothetical protein